MSKKKKSLIVLSSILAVILLLGLCYKFFYKRVDVSKIDSDCEFLRTILSEASIDISKSIDEGLDLDQLIADIKDAYAKDVKKNKLWMKINENGIASNRFALCISDVFEKRLTRPNGHLSATSPYGSYSPFRTKILFYSNILFEKSGTDYKVYSSDNKNITAEMLYTGEEENLFRTIIDGKTLYRYGCRSNKFMRIAKINVEGKEYKTLVKANLGEVQDIKNFSFYTQDDTLYIYSNTFAWHTEADQNRFFDDIDEIGREIQNQDIKTIVFDFRHNSGGNSLICYRLLGALVCGAADKKSKEYDDYGRYYAYLNSNEICINTLTSRNRLTLQGRGSDRLTKVLQRNTKEKYTSLNYDDEDYIKTVSPIYDGKIIFVTDYHTASSTEMLILEAKAVFKDKVIIVGQNTWGALDYANVFQFNLPDSKDSVLLCFSDYTTSPFITDSGIWEGDCMGIAPDYWFTFKDDFELEKVVEFLQ